MKLFDVFTKKAPNKVFCAIFLGALAGIAYSLLIPLVLKALQPSLGGLATESDQLELFGWQVSSAKFAIAFAILCALIFVTRSLSQVLLTRVALEVTTQMRKDMYDRIRKAPIVALEKVGSAKLIAALTTDVQRIVMGARVLPDLLTNGVTLLGMMIFLYYLNRDVFLFVAYCIVFGVVTYQLPMYVSRVYITKSRKHVDNLQEGIRGIINGAKELKLNRAKSDDYFDYALHQQESHILASDKIAQSVLRVAVNYGDILSFMVIGMISFVFVNYHQISSSELIGVVMVLLYIAGPVSVILNAIPQIAIAKVSVRKVNTLLETLPEEQFIEKISPLPEWQSIRFDDVSFRYLSVDDKPGFKVGPLSFEISKGEVVFIVGGNGSGKSTLSKLMTLHYQATEGDIYFGDTKVTMESLASCREEVAAIYSDYHLFKRLFGLKVDPERITQLLRALDLNEKVKVVDNAFSTTSLSDGQRKRLALLVSVLEDKSLYLFDEWAADQDPEFKEIFYTEILPQLKSANKAVVVISHDDRYFKIADKVIRMEQGQLSILQPIATDSSPTTELKQLSGQLNAIIQ
ncbi:cyclic peptide export ABC transporter [Pseudoalteromonas sp. L23]|uniref:cyclic peptide export ABC transporter n=1 Tax=unclassified Pseudoalteromonas TaxID=194690 RepID=UPI001F1B12F8|nr:MULTISPECIES: cyclic peptide export ABC transporter [unclassified Pseudoalteromonas]MCF2829131.1 cyclic peptide export ABC transporter [Pseudoalteromonas sp. OF5H-5]MCF2833908.1 cyclic peptide export ABC transporter [Pseudoalteromonas sp. DL2-H6]MCF2927674.1 cyclic peptide export ABC transporter [Pseudoalteromonas sp. DL2-H1]MCF7515601.1 cyclic peptide export ABC transporter [Pseudoalteromonas sp. L7]MCF7527519.1 cyclic peptide export ABC transporter [Pseudoalteromonas sp. L23]